MISSGNKFRVLESVPGCAHDVTNVGDDDVIVLSRANEMFDLQRTDTVAKDMRA